MSGSWGGEEQDEDEEKFRNTQSKVTACGRIDLIIHMGCMLSDVRRHAEGDKKKKKRDQYEKRDQHLVTS